MLNARLLLLCARKELQLVRVSRCHHGDELAHRDGFFAGTHPMYDSSVRIRIWVLAVASTCMSASTARI